jgi:predicted glycosyltransferase
MKPIWFDIGHPAQLNFYHNAIKSLCKDYNVIITIIGRGKLPKIAKKELSNLPNTRLFIIGKHRGNKFSAIFEANIIRLTLLFLFLVKNRVGIHFSNGYLGSLLSKIFVFPAITFGDDPHSLDYRLKLAFANQVYFCVFSEHFIKLSRKARILKCVKEWAYLNPKYFKADKNELLKYDLEPYSYLFIREVSTGTLNYTGQKYGIIKELADKIPAEYKILFSLEDKSKRQLYPKDWILLQEPVEDIHSLIYFSRALISSGDSMAREAAVLGIPSFYVGNRTMAANEVLKKLVDFSQVDVKNFQTVFGDHTQSFTESDQLKNIEILKNKFIDINDFIKNTAKKIVESN